MARVSVVMGSRSDRGLAEEAASILREFGVDHEVRVLSAHKNPEELARYIEASEAEVFIAVAGLSAALPGFIAAHTTRPVIGVPREVRLGGLDALLSIAQMPTGVPVATVGIDASKNAALLAIRILALVDPGLADKLKEYREKRASNLQDE